jgi:hypothetical protein
MLEERQVSFLVDGVRDEAHRNELAGKVQALRDPGTKSHEFGSSVGYADHDAFFEMSPISDLKTLPGKVGFGRVLAVDPALRIVLIDANDAGGLAIVLGGGKEIDRYAINKSTKFADKMAFPGSVTRHGRDKVVVVCLPQRPAPPEGDPAVLKLRALAPETLETPADFGPQQKGFTYVTVAPIDSVDKVVEALSGEPILAVSGDRRVVLVGDVADLKPLGPKTSAPGETKQP